MTTHMCSVDHPDVGHAKKKTPACADVASRRASASSAFASAAADCASASACRWRASAMEQAQKVHAWADAHELHTGKASLASWSCPYRDPEDEKMSASTMLNRHEGQPICARTGLPAAWQTHARARTPAQPPAPRQPLRGGPARARPRGPSCSRQQRPALRPVQTPAGSSPARPPGAPHTIRPTYLPGEFVRMYWHKQSIRL